VDFRFGDEFLTEIMEKITSNNWVRFTIFRESRGFPLSIGMLMSKQPIIGVQVFNRAISNKE